MIMYQSFFLNENNFLESRVNLPNSPLLFEIFNTDSDLNGIILKSNLRFSLV